MGAGATGEPSIRPAIDEASAYRLISEVTNDYVYSLVPAAGGGFELDWVTDGFERVTGYTLEEIRRRGGWGILIHPSEVAKAAAGVAKLNEGLPVREELQVVRKDGATIWIRSAMRPLLDDDDAVVRILGVAQDVTEEKRAAEAAARYQARLTASFEEAAIGVAILLPDGRLSAVNAELARMLGRSRDSMLGAELCDFAIEEDEDLVRDLPARLSADPAGKERVKVRFRHHDGGEVVGRVNASLVRRSSGEPDYVVAQIADVTEHHRALELLRRRERLLAEAERLAHIGSWEWDVVEDKLVASEECHRMIDLAAHEAPRSFEGFLELVHPDDRATLIRNASVAVQSEASFHMFVRIVRGALGDVRTLQLRGRAERGPGEGDYRIAGAVWDVTEQVHAQRDLMQEAASSRLLSSIARASNTATAETALEVALREVCAFTGWDVGHCYSVSEDDDRTLTSSGLWSGSDDPRLDRFRSVTEETTFVVPDGLPGHVVSSRSFVSAPDIPVEPPFGRRVVAAESGFRSAHAFPVLSGDQVLAVLEFFSFDRTEVDRDLEDLMNTVGVQLGRALERERAARALAESEERFRSLAEAAIDSIISADEEGVIWYANPATARIFGYEPDELVGKLWIELLPARLRAAHLEGREAFVAKRIQGPIGNMIEQVGLRKDGTEFPMELSLSHHVTSRGIVFTGMIRDVTERRRAAAELAHRQQQLEEAQFMAAMGSWEWEPATNTLLYSKGLLSMLGFSQDAELTFEDLQKVVHPADLDDLRITSERIAAQGGGLMFRRFRALMPDGAVKLIETRAQIEPDAEGNVGRIVAVDQDVTERKRAERLLGCQADVLQKVAMREPLRDVLECIAHGIEREAEGATCSILLVQDGVLRNGAAPTLPEPLNQAVDGMEVREGSGPCGTCAFRGVEVVSADITTDPLWAEFADLGAKHGFRASWTSPILSEGREVIGTFALYYASPREPSALDRQLVETFSALASIAIETDRAEKAAARLEAQYRHAQKMEAVGQLAGGIAHDFNNLLQAILAAGQLLSDSLDGNQEQRENVDTVLAGARKGATLVRQLLTFARREPLEPCVLDLNRSIQELTPLINATLGESMELNLVLDPHGVFVEIDPGSFEQVLLNLLSNARDAAGRGGTVWIETFADAGGTSEQQRAVVVRDDGPGMEPDVAARAFDPFFTTKDPGKGSGLGLASVYGAVEAAGGSVYVDSAPGAGTSIVVYLPATEPKEQPAAPGRPPAPDLEAAEHQATILLAEDEDIVAESLNKILTRQGYRVLSVYDGDAALEAGLSDSTPIDLVVTDVVMPGLSGPEVVRRLREAGRSVRVLYMSGYSEDVLHRRDVPVEGDGYITKPFTPEALVAAVGELLHPAPQDGSARRATPSG